VSSTWEPSPLELDGYACRHIEYEVRMLTQQCEALEARWSSVQTGRAVMGADGQALVEAVLVHLRLLDDFLGGRESSHDDVFAPHWDEAWGALSRTAGEQRCEGAREREGRTPNRTAIGPRRLGSGRTRSSRSLLL
jgi:hypothetical protein